MVLYLIPFIFLWYIDVHLSYTKKPHAAHCRTRNHAVCPMTGAPAGDQTHPGSRWTVRNESHWISSFGKIDMKHYETMSFFILLPEDCSHFFVFREKVFRVKLLLSCNIFCSSTSWCIQASQCVAVQMSPRRP